MLVWQGESSTGQILFLWMFFQSSVFFIFRMGVCVSRWLWWWNVRRKSTASSCKLQKLPSYKFTCRKYKDELVVSHWPLLAKSEHNNGCPCNLAPTESRGHTETTHFEVATRLRVSTTKRSAWPHHLQCWRFGCVHSTSGGWKSRLKPPKNLLSPETSTKKKRLSKNPCLL